MTAPRFLVAGAVTAIIVGLAVAIGVPSPRPSDMPERYETNTLVIPPPLRSDRLSVRFTLCDAPIRVNCVVDGDTFWFGRTRSGSPISTPRKSSSILKTHWTRTLRCGILSS
ncbi:hypothetical protein ACVJGB_000751 [Bradyrhizobium liaoningense]